MTATFIDGPVGQLEIVVDSVTGQQTQPIVFLMCHPHPLYQGTMDNKVVTTMTRMLNRMGVTAVRFNYRGVGQSEGAYAEMDGEVEDTLAVLQWIQAQYPDFQIWLGGFSFGGFVAYRAAGQFPVQQLLTLAPGVTTFRTEGVPEPDVPWVVVQSDADEVINPQGVFDWVMQHEIPFHLIKLHGVSHFFHGALVHLRDQLAPIYQARLP